MITVTINGESRSDSQIDMDWIKSKLPNRSASSTCVTVTVKSPEANLTFSTQGCGSMGGSGGYKFNSDEQRLIDRWKQLHLSEEEFSHGNLIAFLQKLL